MTQSLNSAPQKQKFSVAINSKMYQNLIASTLRDPARARRFTAAITSAVAVNPALQECDAGTILAGALLGESLNLSPSPQLGQYYLVPFKQKAKYARIAGMSAEEFSNAWKNDALTALTSFISGLGELDSQGESATLVLDDLGLSGIRQSNMLKSLALAANTLTSAVNVANTAWDENVALTNEANKRYATTKSRLGAAKNSFNNLKIAVGDVEVAKLRAYLRLSHELGFLPMKKYEVWSGMAVEIGKMLGGWLKTIKSQPKT